MTTLSTLIEDLESTSGVVREQARKALVARKDPGVVDELIGKLSDARHQVRWEAAKALADISDPVAAIPLVHAMHDEHTDIAWIAAEGVAGMGKQGLLAILSGLTHAHVSLEYYHAAHHALKCFRNCKKYREEIEIVLQALEVMEPKLAAPVAAYQALQKLRVGEPSSVCRTPHLVPTNQLEIPST